MSNDDYGLEERADFISENELKNGTVNSNFSKIIVRSLKQQGAKIIVGPRGCGKTHLMRATWLHCKNHKNSPIALYVSFTRYYRLEPLLKQQPNAIGVFHSWVLGKLLIACSDLVSQEDAEKLSDVFDDKNEVIELLSTIERGVELSSQQEKLSDSLSIQYLIQVLERLRELKNRKRVVIFFDDAALSLTPEYLVEFFDIFRSLKTSTISPKASVYPGTTEYGPRFHARHDAQRINAWMSIDDVEYIDAMSQVGVLRFQQISEVPEDVRELLMYAAFGIPRVYLTMLRSYLAAGGSTTQQNINEVIQTQTSLMLAEYMSISDKLPQFKDIIDMGSDVFRNMVDQISDTNQNIKTKHKQTMVGLDKEGLDRPHLKRMILLLTEAGLLYQLTSVAHGNERNYERYIPHYASLIDARAFSSGSRGYSAKGVTDFIERQPKKHPLRRKLTSLVEAAKLDALQLNLPACTSCGTNRMSESQKYCGTCGSELVEESAFYRCMRTNLESVPGIPSWQKNEILERSDLRTIGDLLGVQDPASELSKGRLIGPVRSNDIYGKVQLFVDEYLS